MSMEMASMDGRTEDSQPDAPAVPGRADATSVLRSSTPQSQRHVTPQIQPEEAEAQAPVENADKNVDEPKTVDRSLMSLLKECIPVDSKSIWREVIHSRSINAAVRLKSDGPDVLTPDRDVLTPEDVWGRVELSDSSDHSVLVIEDIDDEWCEALCTRYPKSINLKFLLEHILGSRLGLERRESPYDPDDIGLTESMALDLEHSDRAFPCLSDSTTEIFGRHIDCWLEPEPSGLSRRSARGCRVWPTPLGWTQVNRFLSYCELKENFYLVLAPSFYHFHANRDRKLCMELMPHDSLSGFDQRRPPNSVIWNDHRLFASVMRVFGHHWPLFPWKVKAGERNVLSKQKHVVGFLLIAWTVLTTLQANVDKLEGAMRSLAYSTTEDYQERFAQLVEFRRDVGNCYDDLKRAHFLMKSYLEHTAELERMAKRKPFERGYFTVRQSREDLKEPMRAHLAELEKRLNDIKEDLNEELQVAIGAVQLREAQLTREQTRVTARQTTWTVALTVLAAVYLPMTLVTGIFGMNITEISSEATAPNAWWAVGAWVVIVGLTVAGILAYVAISKLKRTRKRKSDLEANDEGETNNDKGKSKVGKWLGKAREDWIRWLKSKAKMVWTPKQE